jgi:WD40 repeat protein
MIFIPAADDLGDEEETDGPNIRPGDVLLTGSADMTARSWSFESGGCLKQFRGHTGAITTMATDSSGRVLFTAGADSTIKSWNIQSGQCLKVSKMNIYSTGDSDSIKSECNESVLDI